MTIEESDHDPQLWPSCFKGGREYGRAMPPVEGA
jgi:hypothetical protein